MILDWRLGILSGRMSAFLLARGFCGFFSWSSCIFIPGEFVGA